MKSAVLDSLLFLLTYMIIQFAASEISKLAMGEEMSAAQLTITLLCGSAATIAVFWLLKWTPIRPNYLRERHWGALFWAMLMPIGLLFPLSSLQDAMQIPVPDALREQSRLLVSAPWAVAVVGFVVPIAEEMVFRGAILRRLMEHARSKSGLDDTAKRRNTAIAVAVSALVFGLVHVYPAQVVNATLMGLLLGYLYARAGSILPCVVLHCANNVIICLIETAMPGIDDMSMSQLAGTGTRMALYIFFSLCVFLPALLQFHRLTKR